MLNSKQRAYLRKLAQTEDAIFQIGKGGINANLITQIKDALERRELIKITILDAVIDNIEDDKNKIAEEIATKTHSEIVHVIGKKITLFKRSTKKPKIEFPEVAKKASKPARKVSKKPVKVFGRTSTRTSSKQETKKSSKAPAKTAIRSIAKNKKK